MPIEMSPLIIVLVAVVVFFITISALISRFKRCPSDKILVVYGRTGGYVGQMYTWRRFLYLASYSRLCLSRFKTDFDRGKSYQCIEQAKHSRRCSLSVYHCYFNRI